MDCPTRYDDPLAILRDAGVECPEVEAYVAQRDDAYDAEDYVRLCEFGSDPAILALARLAAKYKWQRDHEPPNVPIPSLWSRIFGGRGA